MSGWGGLVRRASTGVFQDRREAGRILAQKLVSYRGKPGLLVLGLARGGIPVGWEVASFLNAPLEVFLVRKLGVPKWPELAMGALASGGGVLINDDLVRRLGVSEQDVANTIAREKLELARRERAYRDDRPPTDVRGRTVILVDDGIATGSSMIAALRALRDAAQLVVAVPVGPASVCRELREAADDVVCASCPPEFDSVGQAYADFHQVSDDEVRELLATPTTD